MLDKATNGKVSDLLDMLDKALAAGELEHALDLFQTDCYWRDLVTFTWNIKTMEGKEQVRDMPSLAKSLPSTRSMPPGNVTGRKRYTISDGRRRPIHLVWCIRPSTIQASRSTTALFRRTMAS